MKNNPSPQWNYCNAWPQVDYSFGFIHANTCCTAEPASPFASAPHGNEPAAWALTDSWIHLEAPVNESTTILIPQAKGNPSAFVWPPQNGKPTIKGANGRESCFYQLNVKKWCPTGVWGGKIWVSFKCGGIPVGFVLHREMNVAKLPSSFRAVAYTSSPRRTQTEKARGTGFSSTAQRFPPRESMRACTGMQTQCV